MCNVEVPTRGGLRLAVTKTSPDRSLRRTNSVFGDEEVAPQILPPRDGYLFLDRAKFRASFAADVSADEAAFMADSQVPWGLEALNGAVTEPAWKTKPSWYLVSTE